MGRINNFERSGMGNPYPSSPVRLFSTRKKVTKGLEDNEDVYYRKTVKTKRSGATSTKVRGSALSNINKLAPSASGSHLGPHEHIERKPYMYKGKDKDVSIWEHRLKTKTNKEGVSTKRKEKVVFDDGNQMKKVKQRKVKFGKNKGKIKTVTIQYNRGKKTKTKKYTDNIDKTPILKKK